MSLTIELKVVPSSGRAAWTIDKSGILKCFLKSPPEKGKANKELIMTIAKALRIPQADIMIISGETIKNKKILIKAALTLEQFLHAIGIEQQISLF
jgi:uncharacterized protein (TIGR00251 family)